MSMVLNKYYTLVLERDRINVFDMGKISFHESFHFMTW